MIIAPNGDIIVGTRELKRLKKVDGFGYSDIKELPNANTMVIIASEPVASTWEQPSAQQIVKNLENIIEKIKNG